MYLVEVEGGPGRKHGISINHIQSTSARGHGGFLPLGVLSSSEELSSQCCFHPSEGCKGSNGEWGQLQALIESHLPERAPSSPKGALHTSETRVRLH